MQDKKKKRKSKKKEERTYTLGEIRELVEIFGKKAEEVKEAIVEKAEKK
jgi:hypothetical protein